MAELGDLPFWFPFSGLDRLDIRRFQGMGWMEPDGSGWGFIPIGEGSFESSELGTFSSAASVLSAVSAIKDCRTGWVTGLRVFLPFQGRK